MSSESQTRRSSADELGPVGLPAGDAAEEGLEFLDRRHRRIGDDRREALEDRVDHPLEDRTQQRRLRIEVVVERTPRGVELVEDVLDAHLLVALDLDQGQRGVEEGFATDGVGGGIDGCGPRVGACLG